jgi:antitoxin (DNA-binding transcriptional repressor) of toxin-antitoxin stability system
MKGFKVAEARARFGDLLDQAEQGVPIVIERRGVRFTLAAERAEGRKPVAQARFFDAVDPAILSGEWTWTAERSGLRFRPRRARR